MTVEKDCTVTGELVVPAKVTLLIPYSASDKTGYGVGNDSSSGRLNTDAPYVTLTIGEGTTLTVYGKLVVGGIVAKNCYSYQYQCQTSGAHSAIVNDGTISIVNGGSLECYGYVSGTGIIDADSGSTVKEPIDIEDFVNGDMLLNLFKSGQCPFNRYSLDNIRCTMVIHNGCTLVGDAHIYAAKTLNHTSIKFIGTDDSVMTLKDGATATFTYDTEKYIIDENYENALGSDIGKTTIRINGGADFRAASITLTIIGLTFTESFAQAQFSFPYTFDYILEDGVYEMKESFRILPGCNFTIAEGAYLTVHKKLYVYDGLVDIPWGEDESKKYYPTPELLEKYGFDTCGNLYVDGTLVIDGSFRGTVQSHGNGYVSVKTGADVGAGEVAFGCDYSYKILVYKMDVTRNLTTRTMSGTIYDADGNAFTMVPGTNYKASSGTTTADSFTQTNRIEGTTTTYDVVRTAIGAWDTTDEPVPVPVEKTYVDFEVTPTGDTLDYASVFLMVNYGVRTYDYGPNQFANLIANMSGYSSITMKANAVAEIANADCDLTIILSDGTFRFSAALLNRLSEEDTTLSFITGSDEFNDKQKETCSGLTMFTLSMYQGTESLHELGYNVEVSFTYVPESGKDVDKLRIWYVDEEGKAYNYDAELEGTTLTFKTPHFSAYAVSYADPPVTSLDDLDFTWLYMAIAAVVAGIIALVVIAIFLIRRRRKARKMTA